MTLNCKICGEIKEHMVAYIPYETVTGMICSDCKNKKACEHEKVTTEVSYDAQLDRDVDIKVCDNCEKVMGDENLFTKNRHL